jgi:exodeoxyribonuclease-5
MEFTNDQKQALNELQKFIKSDDLLLTIIGSAGVGKTFIVEFFIKYLLKNKIYRLEDMCVAAPTHKAKEVIASKSVLKGYTLHSLLGLGLDLDLTDFDPLDPTFRVIKKQDIDNYGLVFIDESSMINTELYKHLKDCAYRNFIKLVFLGDALQLSPVNDCQSAVFTDNKTVELTEIVRQEKDNPLILLLNRLRQDILDDTCYYLDYFKPGEYLNTLDKGYIITSDKKDFAEKLVFFNKNNIESKLLNYTNEVNNIWNNYISEQIFGKGFHKNQLILGTRTLRGKDEIVIQNSKDYIVFDVKPSFKYFNNEKVTGYILSLIDSVEYITEVFCPDEVSKPIIGAIIGERLGRAKRFGGGKAWSEYFKFRSDFVLAYDIFDNNNNFVDKKDITFGYSSTVHKSQGSTYFNVFVNYVNISKVRNLDEQKRLLYVALSRASNNAYILIK